MKALLTGIGSVALVAALVGSSGCTTQSYCFADCGDEGAGGGDGDGGPGMGGNGGGFQPGSGGDGGGFNPGAGGNESDGGCGVAELCNGADDDCDGEVDEDIDFTNPRQCGNCATNCFTVFAVGVEQESVSCMPPAQGLGTQAGSCSFTQCAQDFFDIDGDTTPGCEYFCEENPDRADIPDVGGEDGCGRDDDCDGQIDEDVGLCDDVENCGRCGKRCSILNGTGRCETSAAQGEACTEDNTACEVDQCDAGWVDADGAAENGCEYECTASGAEICDGLDNDCDGQIDNADADLEVNVAAIGTECFGSDKGICAVAANAGFNKCVGGQILCCDKDSNNVTSDNPNFPSTGLRNGECEGSAGPFVIRPGDVPETCNNLDDDCDDLTDDDPVDAGSTCGSSVGACDTGTEQCVDGDLVCAGETEPVDDVCDGSDNNCDGVIDGIVPATGLPVSCTADADCSGGRICRTRTGPSDKICVDPPDGTGTQCGASAAPPCVNAAGAEVACGTAGASPAPQPCTAGVLTCTGGTTVCVGDQGPLTTTDQCGADSNCNGSLDNQPNFQTSIANCGGCGNDCRTGGAHVNWTCNAGTCEPDSSNKCQAGYLDCDSDPDDCETACIPSGNELCNDFDDDCDCQVDEDPAVPTPVQVCGVAQTASEGGCTSGVTVSCVDGGWSCAFPNNYCTGGNCAATTDKCDGVDNNCNGIADEGFVAPFRTTRAKGQTCYSDEGLPPPGHGACRGQGVYQCNSAGTDTECPAQIDLSDAGTEICNGEDDDCDSIIDEVYNTAADTTNNYIRPAVANLGSNIWMYRYEASRPNATDTTPGNGNGYHTSAPSGTTLDATIACSTEDKIPWFNVTPIEAEQTCTDIGGRLCTLSDWQRACHAASSCDWGYGTVAACTAPANYAGTPYCNLHGFDFDTGTAGNQDGLLPTGSDDLASCFANYGGNQPVYDITGNLREITKDGTNYVVMGGAFNTHSETGASCDFDFFSVSSDFLLYDTGFRCCFGVDPSAP